ncbi:MAG: hypothetical protein A2Z98_10250 [Spirochaetes bacterium GWB1_27_13]|nr:MAG: hypothetical protein A2Z98_10250 [Spirochaetes bacterium GWB1_27_13]
MKNFFFSFIIFFVFACSNDSQLINQTKQKIKNIEDNIKNYEVIIHTVVISENQNGDIFGYYNGNNIVKVQFSTYSETEGLEEDFYLENSNIIFYKETKINANPSTGELNQRNGTSYYFDKDQKLSIVTDNSNKMITYTESDLSEKGSEIILSLETYMSLVTKESIEEEGYEENSSTYHNTAYNFMINDLPENIIISFDESEANQDLSKGVSIDILEKEHTNPIGQIQVFSYKENAFDMSKANDKIDRFKVLREEFAKDDITKVRFILQDQEHNFTYIINISKDYENIIKDNFVVPAG